MFSGDYCEVRLSSSGSWSLLLFIFTIGLILAGIALLWQNKKYRDEFLNLKNKLQG